MENVPVIIFFVVGPVVGMLLGMLRKKGLVGFFLGLFFNVIGWAIIVLGDDDSNVGQVNDRKAKLTKIARIIVGGILILFSVPILIVAISQPIPAYANARFVIFIILTLLLMVGLGITVLWKGIKKTNHYSSKIKMDEDDFKLEPQQEFDKEAKTEEYYSRFAPPQEIEKIDEDEKEHQEEDYHEENPKEHKDDVTEKHERKPLSETVAKKRLLAYYLIYIMALLVVAFIGCVCIINDVNYGYKKTSIWAYIGLAVTLMVLPYVLYYLQGKRFGFHTCLVYLFYASLLSFFALGLGAIRGNYGIAFLSSILLSAAPILVIWIAKLFLESDGRELRVDEFVAKKFWYVVGVLLFGGVVYGILVSVLLNV